MITPAYSLTANERVLPRLALDFTTGVLDPRVTVTRALNTATRTNSSGFIEAVNADTPRFDYSFTSVGTPLGLLIEEQRTNLLLYSNDLRNTTEAGSSRPWADSFGALTVTANDGIGPDGQNSASKFSFSASDFPGRQQTVTLDASSPYTFSFWIKRISGLGSGWIQVEGSGVINAFAGFTATSSWTRVTVSGTTTSGGSANVYIYPEYSTNRTGEYLVWGTQIEKGAFVTSNILTTTTSLTRNTDVVLMTGTNFSSWYNATEGTLFAKGTFIAPADSGVSVMASISNGFSGESINIYRQSNLIYLSMYGSATQAIWSVGTTNQSQAAIACKLNNVGAAVNSIGQIPDTAATLPNANRMEIGRMWSGTFGANGWISNIMYWPQRLTDAELQAFTK